MKLKPWWDTRRCRNWPLQGLVVYLIGKRIAYTGHNRPANDSWTGN